jgi:hypothetical protein
MGGQLLKMVSLTTIYTMEYGKVPLSVFQIWGELLYTGKGDHLEACGHFDDLKQDPPDYDWLATGSGFDRPQFESLWGSVTDFLLRPPS